MRFLHRGAAVTLALLVVLSVLAPFAVAPAAAASPPSGLDAVPAENVGPPDHANVPPGAVPPASAGPKAELASPPASIPTDAAAWDVHASDHAADLTVEVGTTEDGRLALRLGDSVNHAGRDVAVDAETLTDALGYRPEVVSGLHSSGERWTETVAYRGGYAVFSVPRFSTNTVTFDGDVSIQAAPAESGDTFSYDVADTDAVSNFSVDLTGHTHRETLSTTSTVTNGSTVGLDVGGTTDPVNATLTVTGRQTAGTGDVLWSTTEHTASGQGVDTMNGTLYSVGNDGVLVAYDVSTGSVSWSTTVAGTDGLYTVDAEDGTIYVGDGGGTLHAVDTSGSVLWSDSVASTYLWSVDYEPSTGLVYVGDDSGTVTAWDHSTGSASWSHDLHSGKARDVEYHNGTVYSASYDETVKAYDVESSSEAWSHSIHTNGVIALDYDPATETVYSGAGDGRVVSFDAANTSENWNVSQHSNSAYALEYRDGTVYTGGFSDNRTVAYDVSTRSVLWEDYSHDGVKGIAVSGGGSTAFSVGDDDYAAIAYEAKQSTESVSVDLDGTTVLSHSGTLGEGETVTETVNLSTSSSELSVSLAEGTEADLNLTRTEVTETVDPEVTVNGHTVGYDGVLADGETTSLNVSDGWIEAGTNNVTARASTTYDGPVGMVDLDYRHEATEARSVSYEATVWSENYDVSKTYVSDVSNAVLRVPWASDRVVSVRSLTVTVNGTEVSPTYASENGTLTVELGEVSEGATVNVSAVGSKVAVSGGTIEVVNATESGLSLDSKVRVTSITDPENLTIAVGGTGGGHLLHYTAAESWDSATDYATAYPDGSQDLHTDAPEGATFRVRTIPVEVTPSDVAVEALVVEASDSSPRFRLREAAGEPEASEVEVIYYATTSGETYELYDTEAERQVDTDTAESPVSFLADGGTTTYLIELYDSGSAPGDGAAAVAVGSSDGGSGLAPAAVIVAAAVAVVGVVLVGRRFGVTGRRRTLLLGTVAAVVAVIATEAVTQGSVLALLAEAVLDPLVDSQVGVIGGGIGLLLGVYAIHDWIGLPWWVLGLAVAGDAVWVLDTITDGALAGGLGEVSALLWLVGIFGGMYLLYTRLKPRDIVIRQ